MSPSVCRGQEEGLQDRTWVFSQLSGGIHNPQTGKDPIGGMKEAEIFKTWYDLVIVFILLTKSGENKKYMLEMQENWLRSRYKFQNGLKMAAG